MSETLGLSRTTAWQHLRSLEQSGIELHAVHGKGTRLAVPIELLALTNIERELSDEAKSLLGELMLLDEVHSTNQFLMDGRNSKWPNGSVCVAEMQTRGRGRQGRSWVSPFGQNIYLSVLWRFDGGLAALSGLSLACGVAATRALNGLGVPGIGLKWPNDLLWQGRKLGGILVEVHGETEGSYTAVIGMGINFQMDQALSRQIDQPWADVVSIHPQAKGHRNELLARVMNEVLPMLARYQDTGLAPYLDEWSQLDCLKQRPVQLTNGQNVREGIAQGINAAGELLLRDAGGELHRVNAGEVSLRAVG